MGLKMQKEEEWSKERIIAEMYELEKAKTIRFWIGFSFLGVGVTIGLGFVTILSFSPFSRYLPIGLYIIYLIGSIGLILVGLFFVKSWREKSRKYNEFKAKL